MIPIPVLLYLFTAFYFVETSFFTIFYVQNACNRHTCGVYYLQNYPPNNNGKYGYFSMGLISNSHYFAFIVKISDTRKLHCAIGMKA